MNILKEAIDHLLETANSDFGWLSNAEVLHAWKEYSEVELRTGETIDVGQMVEEVLLIALPHIRKQIANEIRSMKMVGNTAHLHLQYNGALEIAAQTAQEGTTK